MPPPYFHVFSFTLMSSSKTKKDSRRSSAVNVDSPEDLLNSSSKIEDMENPAPIYKIPSDPRLISYIEDVVETISPLRTVIEQVSELGRYIHSYVVFEIQCIVTLKICVEMYGWTNQSTGNNVLPIRIIY